jgi:hemimethylated DNA binding protein
MRSAAWCSTSIRCLPIPRNGIGRSRPRCARAKDQPFYHLFAENDQTEYIAYVSEQNLLPDLSGEPVRHPQVAEVFVRDGKTYRPRDTQRH